MIVVNFIKRYLLNMLIVLDISINALILFGSPYESISSRAGKAQLAGKRWGCVLCGILDRIQKNHCQMAMQALPGSDAIVQDDNP